MSHEGILELNFDKSDWIPLKLGDVVYEPKESVKDPHTSGVKHVVGLEHIDSEDIRLRRCSGIENGTTFTKKFTKGDVLFGRRRAYLKKAAQANFDGICSGDIIVMRARLELLIPELLPFIVNNDSFFDYAVQHSAGGLSPRVKFKDLANYKLLLPPIEQQVQLAELMLSINDDIEKKISLAEKSNQLIRSLIQDLLKNGTQSRLQPKTYDEIAFESLVERTKDGIRRGPFGSALRKELFTESGIKVYEQSNVIENDFKKGNYFIDSEYFDRLRNFEVYAGDILISCSGTIGKVAIVPEDAQKGVMNQALLRARLDEKIVSPKFFKFLFESELMQVRLLQKTQGSAMKNLVALKQMKKIKFPIVDLHTQEKILSLTEKIQTIESTNIEHSKKLKNCIVERIF